MLVYPLFLSPRLSIIRSIASCRCELVWINRAVACSSGTHTSGNGMSGAPIDLQVTNKMSNDHGGMLASPVNVKRLSSP